MIIPMMPIKAMVESAQPHLAVERDGGGSLPTLEEATPAAASMEARQ